MVKIRLRRMGGHKEPFYRVVVADERRARDGKNIETQQEFWVDKRELEPYREKSDVAKAIYRMCCIGLIDDFTEDYGKKVYRVVAKRKPDGTYYKTLQTFLERYYTKEKAAEMATYIPESGGDGEGKYLNRYDCRRIA